MFRIILNFKNNVCCSVELDRLRYLGYNNLLCIGCNAFIIILGQIVAMLITIYIVTLTITNSGTNKILWKIVM